MVRYFFSRWSASLHLKSRDRELSERSEHLLGEIRDRLKRTIFTKWHYSVSTDRILDERFRFYQYFITRPKVCAGVCGDF